MSVSTVAERTDALLAEYGASSRRGAGCRRRRGCAISGQRGAARFAALGFPTVRQEEWRFTNVAPIAETRVSSRREGADQCGRAHRARARAARRGPHRRS